MKGAEGTRSSRSGQRTRKTFVSFFSSFANLLLPFFTCTPRMSSRINIARPATASYNSDPHGLSNSRPSSSGMGYRSANPDDPIEKLRAYAAQVEDYVEIYSQPLKPHLPAIGRFLIVVTFLEDALRITTQWSDQIWYLQKCVFYYSSWCWTDKDALLDTVPSHGASHTCSCLSTCSYVSSNRSVEPFLILYSNKSDNADCIGSRYYTKIH